VERENEGTTTENALRTVEVVFPRAGFYTNGVSRGRVRGPLHRGCGGCVLNSSAAFRYPPSIVFPTSIKPKLRALLALLMLVAAGGTSAASPTLDRIKAKGVVTFGYRDAAAPFSVRQRDGRVRGYSVELCEKVAATLGKALGLPDLRVEWRPVDSNTRISYVADGTIDAECGTTTMTLSRMERVDFSLPIFVDGGSALVRAKEPLLRWSDFKDKRIAVIAGTTTESALKKALDVFGIVARFVYVKDGDEGVALLLAGKVDGYASDRMLLTELKAGNLHGEDLAFVPTDFSFEPYAVVLPRNDADFRLLVNRTLVNLYKSGEIDQIFLKWLAPYGTPGPLLNSMFYLNTLPD
jgi:glutamate/aspartate transport system substrate-binding protein